MHYSTMRLDEIAQQAALIEQTTATALATVQEQLADLRAAMAAFASGGDAPYDARAFGNGLDPVAVVTTDRATVIRVPHTFDNETTPQAPFILGANTSGQLVTGFNADMLDGQEGAYYADYANLTNKPTNIAACNAGVALNLTTALQDVAGLTTGSFTPSVAEKALVIVSMTLNKSLGSAPCNNGDAIVNQLQVNGGEVLSAAITADSGAGSLAMTRVYVATLMAGTAYTIKVQSQNTTGNRGQIGAGSQMVVWRMGI